MRRPLAKVLAAALVVLPATAARAEPLDLDLAGLGAPRADVLLANGTTTDPIAASQLANDAKVRFATLSSELILALSTSLLQPASTTGHSGFDFDMETAYVPVHPRVEGDASAWPTRSMTPYELLVPSFHVRKALPYSFELGGRVIYLSQSSYVATQVEAKWAVHEGFDDWPELAVRGAWTQLFGQRDWSLGAGELDVILSKRWGAGAVTSFTPYAAARYSWVNASSDVMDFGSQPTDPLVTRMQKQAAFPLLSAGFYRTTVGLRMTAYAVSLAAEGTYLGGGSAQKLSAGANYPTFKLKSSIASALKLGFEF
jgi:hypothetical protein